MIIEERNDNNITVIDMNQQVNVGKESKEKSIGL